MGDIAVWVAALTGGTAVLASWVTNLGNVRAARVQAEASAQAQHRGRVRESRRGAYLELMEHAHVIGELYRQVIDAFHQITDLDQQLTRFEELRSELREAYDPLMHSVRVVILEGPPATAEAAQGVLDAAQQGNRCLWRITCGDADAHARFDEVQGAYLRHLSRFVEAARVAMEAS
ncbi:hypothetical protein [Streptomyces sp. AS02]|uniref:hypothetical protein n=1 Tax=Streptomyces sp. AS02 TaxID=2938946 RepID=UPI0020205D9C|nr:hypothetical protein [Streptomyces sp. AS02]MCL8017996.1 hypothetical protein [Streptomyces sp. AS02]